MLQVNITGAIASHVSMNELYLCADDWCEDDMLSLDPLDSRIESLDATQTSSFGPGYVVQSCLDEDEGTTCSSARTSSQEGFSFVLRTLAPEVVRAFKIVHYADESERPVEVSASVDGVELLRENVTDVVRSTLHHILPTLSYTRIVIQGYVQQSIRLGEVYFIDESRAIDLFWNSSDVWGIIATQSSNAYPNTSLAESCIDNNWSTFCQTDIAGSVVGETLNLTLVTYEANVGVVGFVSVVDPTDSTGYPNSFSLYQVSTFLDGRYGE